MSHESALKHAASASAPPADFSGRWENQLGSTMNIAVDDAAIAGTYTSAVSSDGGQVSGRLSGFINGDLIAFTVNWQPTAAITAWVGQLVDERETQVIKALWQMTTNVADAEEPAGLWASVYAGADTFERSRKR